MCLLVATKPAIRFVVQQAAGVAVSAKPGEEPIVDCWPFHKIVEACEKNINIQAEDTRHKRHGVSRYTVTIG